MCLRDSGLYRTTPSDLHRIHDAQNVRLHALTQEDQAVAATMVALEGGLRTVAVMDVEIDDGDPAKAMFAPRPLGAEDDIVEQAKAHRTPGLGVMAGRAHGAEGVVCLARHYRIHRGTHGAGGAQGGLAGSR